MSKEEYEIITHNNYQFHVFMVNVLYRTPHIHKDYEIGLVLDGKVSLTSAERVVSLAKNDLFILNPFQSHELSAKKPALILALQVSPAFFASYFPVIYNVEFTRIHIPSGSDLSIFLYRTMLDLAVSHFSEEEYSAIQCVIMVNQIFLSLLQQHAHRIVSEKGKETSLARGSRIQRIMKYIDEHHTEKLMLSAIAKEEGMDFYYLSHLFKDTVGIPFQSYLAKIRCEHARQMLLLTDYSLLDVCIGCGFSDPKYFNKDFKNQYGCTPKEYRRNINSAETEQRQKSISTTQRFLSCAESIQILQSLND